MAWIIKGESGAALNATSRSFTDLNLAACNLQFSSAGRDTLTWRAKTTSATGTGTIVPDFKQVVELWNGSTRKFRGHVASSRVRLGYVEVRVEGPWWWMEQIDLTSVLTDGTAVDEERVKYIATADALDQKIRNLIDRSIDLGVPITRGGTAAMWDTPKITLSGKSCAAGLTALLARCPDAVCYFDYSTGATLPESRVVRRGGAAPMADVDYTVGENGLEDADIYPRVDLKVSRVEINYLDRHPTTGKVRYKRQSTGTAATGTGAASETQKLTLSGDELVDFVPLEEYESVVVKSIDWADITSTQIKAGDAELASIQDTYGSVPGARAAYVTMWTGAVGDKDVKTVTCPTFRRVSVSGKALTAAQKWMMTSTTPLPEWAKTELGAIEVDIVGGWAATWTSTAGWSDSFKAVMAGATMFENYWANSTPNDTDKIDVAVRSFKVRAWLLSAEYAANTTIYKPMEYGFPAPPAGMSSGLRDAQNWTPWEGTITLAGAVHCTGSNNLNKCVNLLSTLTACATMRATAKTLSYDLFRERTVWSLGPPPRMNFGTSSGRVPSSSQDTIEPL
jgi:hypothetical protein